MEFFLNDLSIFGIIECLQVNAKKVQAAQNASNIILFMFFVAYLFNKKACYLVGFLFVEIVSNLLITDLLTNSGFYLLNVFMFCLIYWYGVYKAFSLKTLLGYGTMILFQLFMVLDAKFYNDVETFLSSGYENIIMVIYIYIISTLFRWETIGKYMGECFSFYGRFFGYSYNISFIWYTITTQTRKSED